MLCNTVAPVRAPIQGLTSSQCARSKQQLYCHLYIFVWISFLLHFFNIIRTLSRIHCSHHSSLIQNDFPNAHWPQAESILRKQSIPILSQTPHFKGIFYSNSVRSSKV